MARNIKKGLFDGLKFDTVRRNSARSSKWLDNKIAKSDWKKTTRPVAGKIYLFNYRAKYAATLPIWDKHPLSVMFGVGKGVDGSKTVYGLNFHYLMPKERIALMELLHKISKSKNAEMLSVKALRTLALQKRWKKAIKQYLVSHMRGNLVEVPQTEWENIVPLKLAKWHKN